MKSGNAKATNRDDLLKLLESAADLIRTAVDYNVILLLLFYKAISDKWDSIVSRYKSQGYGERDSYLLANEELINLYYADNGKVLSWSHVVRAPETIQEMDKALLRISEINPKLGELKTLLNRLGLTELSKGDKWSILVKLVELFNKYDFSAVDYDILGDAYQWILAKFAPTKAKEGETYTPREVIRLMVKLLDIEDSSKVLDPASGSAAMLIEAYKYVSEKLGGNSPTLKLYGQDFNEVVVAVAKMNLILHNITADAEIYVGDSLVNPRFVKALKLGEDGGGADYVLANPPWNQDGYGEDRLNRPELRKVYKYGYPPNNTADWAWIQLMLWASRKKVAVVIDQGALFRGGREADIRRRVVDEDLIDAVILLPEKLFYNTGAPGVIILFDKQKPPERKGKILFINASNEYEPHPEVRRLNRLGDGHIDKIVSTYRQYKSVEGFSRVVDLKEIRNNNYNLNVTLYVQPLLESVEVDLEKELHDLEEIAKQARETEAKAIQYIRQIIQTFKTNNND